MSDGKPPALSDKGVFTSSDFLEFLNRHGGPELARLEVRTKSGDTISRTFHSRDGDDVFKSIDLIKDFFPTDEGRPPHPMGHFTSGDWTVDFARDHVDVPYDNQLFTGNGTGSARNTTSLPPQPPPPPPPPSSSSLFFDRPPPEKKRTDFYAMYNNDLSSLIEAAKLARPQPIDDPEPTTPPIATPKPEKKKKSRKLIPDEKEYVDACRDQDVLFGRGGRSNHHPGNKMYRELVTAKQEYYRSCDKNTKTTVAQSIVDTIHNEQKGRFLEKDPSTNRYYIVPTLTARRKVGQALRENNTEEARAAKREKYGKKNEGKTSTTSSFTSSDPSPSTTRAV